MEARQLMFEKLRRINSEAESALLLGHEEECMDLLLQCADISTMILNSSKRAMEQVLYNELMVGNATKDLRKSNDFKDYVFLTINPPDQLDHTKLVTAVRNFTHLCVCEWSYYVFEQRGSIEGDYHGFHTHILFKRARRPSEVIDNIYRTFLPLVPDKAKINWWSKDTEKEIVNALAYMKGKKDDPSKAPAIANNTAMRLCYSLEEIYSVGEPPLLVGGSQVVKLPLKLK